jgi:hypothetical protein
LLLKAANKHISLDRSSLLLLKAANKHILAHHLKTRKEIYIKKSRAQRLHAAGGTHAAAAENTQTNAKYVISV